jgi:hypothetical protein
LEKESTAITFFRGKEMYAKWIGEDRYVGPKWKRTLAIKNGDIRKIHAKDGDMYILMATPGSGYQFHGWVNGENLEIIEDEEKCHILK